MKFYHPKWEIVFLFFVSTLLIIAVIGAGWAYYYNALTGLQALAGAAAIVLLVGNIVGLIAAIRFQRKIDALHLGLIQISKGNLAGRVPFALHDSFGGIYKDFNRMAESLEQRIRLMQKQGEEGVVSIAKSVDEAVYEERRRLARDLHDTVSQQLFAIHMSSASLARVLETNPDAGTEVINQLTRMSHHAQRQMRGLIAQLRPLELDGRTLSEALDKWFPDFCAQNGLQGKLDLRIREALPESFEGQLFMIIQEGMANVVKHASAANVSLSLYDIDHQYVVQLTDDGHGFDSSSVRSGSYGLSTMRERAQKLGGDVEILTRPGAGTQMKAHIPKFD